MPEIFNPVDDLIAEQALVDALVADAQQLARDDRTTTG